jgi:RNA polymerase sigma factor (sigma-70 family)
MARHVTGAQPADGRSSGCTEDHLHADFAVFVKAHLNSSFLPVARRYAGFRGVSDAAPDIAQEALKRVWPRWEKELAAAPCWRRCAFVCKTMSNVAHELHRQLRRAGEVFDPWAMAETVVFDTNPEERYLAREMLRAVVSALSDLADDERLIIDLSIAKVPHAEIAVQLGTTATNISTRLHRIRCRLLRSIDTELLNELGRRRTDNDNPGGAA